MHIDLPTPIIIMILVAIFGIGVNIGTGRFMDMIPWVKLGNDISGRVIKDKSAGVEEISLYEAKLEYTLNIQRYIKDVVAETSAIEFASYIASHDFDKATRENIKPVIRSVANRCRDAIRLDKLDYTALEVSKEYLEKYIIDLSVKSIRSLVDKGTELAINMNNNIDTIGG